MDCSKRESNTKHKLYQQNQICQLYMDGDKYRQNMHTEGFVNALLAIPAGIFQSNYTGYGPLYIVLWVIVHVQGQNGDSRSRNVTCRQTLLQNEAVVVVSLQRSAMESLRSVKAGGENYCCRDCWVLLVFFPTISTLFFPTITVMFTCVCLSLFDAYCSNVLYTVKQHPESSLLKLII